MNQNRRQVLRISGLTLAGVLAGCSGGDGGGGETTTEATATEEVTTEETTTEETTTEASATTERTTTEETTTTAPTTSGASESTAESTPTGEGSTANASAGTTSTGNGSTTGGSGSQAEIEEWLSETSNYGGSVEGMTGTDSVEVAVGASGNGGNFAFAPPAIRVSSGTTVTWQWTGEGNAHNVVASEGAFDSGDRQEGSDVTFEHPFEETGTFLYYCEPHRSLEMKGAVVVE